MKRKGKKMDDSEKENEDGMMFMVPDVLVARMEQVRRLNRDLAKADEDQTLFLKQAILLLLESCDPKFSKIHRPQYDNNITPIN